MRALSHLGPARPSRFRAAACARCATSSPGLLFDCGDSLRGSQTVYSPRRADHRRDRRSRLRRASDRQPRVPLPVSAAARARAQDAPSAGLHESARHQGPRAAVRAVADDATIERHVTIHVLGLADHAVSGRQSLGAHLRLALSRSVGCGGAVRAARARRRHAARALARRAFARSRARRNACRASI